MSLDGFDEFYNKVTDGCLSAFDRGESADAVALADSLMQMPGFPMHYPVHHYLVPAVLLTVCRKKQGHGREVLERDLATALDRARKVPGGSCGFMGACGAAVGVGIFWSVITDATPVSGESWAYGNRATAKALLAMAEIGGPRCCKRCTWLALLSTAEQISGVLGLSVEMETPVCCYHDHNQECLKNSCPFYPKEADAM
jgi:hypothetical protein